MQQRNLSWAIQRVYLIYQITKQHYNMLAEQSGGTLVEQGVMLTMEKSHNKRVTWHNAYLAPLCPSITLLIQIRPEQWSNLREHTLSPQIPGTNGGQKRFKTKQLGHDSYCAIDFHLFNLTCPPCPNLLIYPV